MDGGPSHKDTFDLKPESKGAGEFKPIKTSAPGIEISEHLPEDREADAPRRHSSRHEHRRRGAPAGQVLLAHRLPRRTRRAHLPVASARSSRRRSAAANCPMPNFVDIGNRSFGSGFLGPEAPAAFHHRPDSRRPGSPLRRRGHAVRQPRRAASGTWSRRSTASTRPTRSTITRPPTPARSS